ncbi:MAG: type II secretion system protein [Chthoniobacteraceae bacterium]
MRDPKAHGCGRHGLDQRNQPGFTLIELLVVMAVIAVLAAILFAVSSTVFSKSHSSNALADLRQLGVAMALYTGDHSYNIPGRITGKGESKWPMLLADYLKDPRVYAAPGLPNYLTENEDPLSNAKNCTSFILNGFNDRGTYNNENVRVRINQFSQLSQVILFGMQIDTSNFYMDFVEKNQDGVLKLDAYDNASVYLFADGSAKLISKADYTALMPSTRHPLRRLALAGG